MKHVAIFGAPRSGTSWLGQMFNSSPLVAYRFQPLFSYAFKGRLRKGASQSEIKQFYEELFKTTDDFILQTENVSGRKEELHFYKEHPSHLVWKEVRYHYVIEGLLTNSDTKIIGIIRHPCAVINSWLNAPKEFKTEWNPVEEWRFANKKNGNRKEEYNGYEKWKELAFLYMALQERFPQQFNIVVYEDLNLHTEMRLKELYAFCNLPWHLQTAQFIEYSKSKENGDPYSVFKKQKVNNNWRGSLSYEIEIAIMNDPDFARLNDYYQWNI